MVVNGSTLRPENFFYAAVICVRRPDGRFSAYQSFMPYAENDRIEPKVTDVAQ